MYRAEDDVFVKIRDRPSETPRGRAQQYWPARPHSDSRLLDVRVLLRECNNRSVQHGQEVRPRPPATRSGGWGWGGGGGSWRRRRWQRRLDLHVLFFGVGARRQVNHLQETGAVKACLGGGGSPTRWAAPAVRSAGRSLFAAAVSAPADLPDSQTGRRTRQAWWGAGASRAAARSWRAASRPARRGCRQAAPTAGGRRS